VANLRELIDLDVKLTNRDHAFLNTRARRARKANFLPLGGHGLSAAQYGINDTVNYILCSLTTFVKASEVAEEIPAFAKLKINEETWASLTADEIWEPIASGAPEAWGTFGGTLGELLKLGGDPAKLSSSEWGAVDAKYSQRVVSLRKSVDTRDSTITLEPKTKGEPPFHIQFTEPFPEGSSIDYPLWETVTVPFSFIKAFGRLIAEGSDD